MMIRHKRKRCQHRPHKNNNNKNNTHQPHNRKRRQHHNNNNSNKHHDHHHPIPKPQVAPPKISTPAQEFAEWKRETGIYDMALSQYQEFAAWKQKMELYDTSMLDL